MEDGMIGTVAEIDCCATSSGIVPLTEQIYAPPAVVLGLTLCIREFQMFVNTRLTQ